MGILAECIVMIRLLKHNLGATITQQLGHQSDTCSNCALHLEIYMAYCCIYSRVSWDIS